MGGSSKYLMSGLAEGLQQGQENARRNNLLSSQSALIKQQAKLEELKLKAAAEEDAYFAAHPELAEQRFTKGKETFESKLAAVQKMFAGAAPQPAPEPEPFGGGTEMFPLDPSLTAPAPVSQQIAAGQFGGLTQDDLFRGVMKKEFGAEAPTYNRTATVMGPDGQPWVVPMNNQGVLDMTKAMPAPVKPDMQAGVGEGMAPTQTPVNPYSRQPMGAPIQTGAPPTMTVETPTGGGGKVKSVVPLFPGVRGSKVSGTTVGGVRTELDLLDVPIPASDVTKWSDGSGNNPPVGWTPRQAQGRGFKQTQEGMPAETGGKAVMLNQAISDIEVAEKLLFPAPGKFNRKLALGSSMNLPEAVVKDAQVAQSSIENAIAAKLRLETGAQANDDEIKHISKRFFPSAVRDNAKSAKYKMDRLKQFMKEGKFVMDPKGRITIVEPQAKPSLDMGKKKDPSQMTDEEIKKELEL